MSPISAVLYALRRGLDWLKLRDFLGGPNSGRDLIEMVVYAGLPPAVPAWQEERDRKISSFMAALEPTHGRDQRWWSAEEGHY